MRFRNIDVEVGIRTDGCKIKGQWQRIGIYIITYKDKQKRMVRRQENEVETNLDDQ
jgi:hypothetical protein